MKKLAMIALYGLIILFISLNTACTPVTYTTQSQQTWNEYKGKGVTHVKRAKDVRSSNPNWNN